MQNNPLMPDGGGIPGLMGVNGIQQQQQILGNPEAAQQFCLRWNSYPATVATQLAALRLTEDFVDVTLACDGKQLLAHKLVLSACSPYFMQLFKSTPCQHPVIFLKDVGFRQLVALIEFMYAGEVNVSQVELPALLRTAEALQVRGLADTTTNNSNSNCAPPPKPTFSPSYGQNVGAPVMPNNPPANNNPPLPVESQICSEPHTESTQPQTEGATSPKQMRRDERSANVHEAENINDKRGDDEESDSNDSHEEFEAIDQEMKVYAPDNSISGQIEEPDTAEFVEGDGEGGEGDEADMDADPLNVNQPDVGGGTASITGSQSEDEESEDEEDDDDGECKDTYLSDASYSQETMPEGNANGESTPGPSSGGGSGDGDGESGNLGKDDASGGSGGGAGGATGGRNRLSRSLWPPGIPYAGPQQCPYCPRTLSNVGNWRKHVLTMHFAREKVYKCRHCASSFRTAEYLQKHYVRVHNYPQKMTRRKYVEQT